MNNDTKKIIISIIVVTLIVVLVGGATFAYWSWSSSDAQKTNVTFTVEDLSSSMYCDVTISGTGVSTGVATASNLQPVANCADDALATAGKIIKNDVVLKCKNGTTRDATASLNLNVTTFTLRASAYQPESGDLSSLKWITTSGSGVTNASTCDSMATSSGGTFSGLTFTSGATTANNLPFELKKGTSAAITQVVPAGTTTETTYTWHLYTWLDDSYTHTNVGTVNSDPMQGLTFKMQWSGTIARS